MGTSKSRGFSRLNRLNKQDDEHIAKREKLRNLVGTDKFPEEFSKEFADYLKTPDDLEFWIEMYVLHLLRKRRRS